MRYQKTREVFSLHCRSLIDLQEVLYISLELLQNVLSLVPQCAKPPSTKIVMCNAYKSVECCFLNIREK